MAKMIPYLDNCDMVIGSRMTQVLSEETNQNDTFLVWGNKFLGAYFWTLIRPQAITLMVI